MGLVSSYWELGFLRFMLGALNAALLPAVQTLIIYNISHQVTGRIFSYNQALRDVGNVTGPLMGSFVAATYGFRAVFFFTAALVLFNLIYSWLVIRRQSDGLRASLPTNKLLAIFVQKPDDL